MISRHAAAANPAGVVFVQTGLATVRERGEVTRKARIF
jgi:hypothetical protein